MDTAKIVMGANFGDEGKGGMTDYFAYKAKEQKVSCLVVCHNGGSQKGHTVVSPSGLRHVFHHFGSGCFEGADTYLASEFIVNPLIFNKEREELKTKGKLTKCFVNPNCRVTTPFDMMINQIVEESRGNNKHGSCGLGIFETVMRTSRPGTSFLEFASMSNRRKKEFLDEIVFYYVPHRLRVLGIDKIPTKWADILNKKDTIIDNFINEFDCMQRNVVVENDTIIDSYNYVIFEGAQGLLLDQNNVEYMPHLTPSNTGIKNPLDIIDIREADIEVCYVSRTYMTRHGAGRFDTECGKEAINPKIVDLTNIPNPFQDTIRYGKLNLTDLRSRIDCDFGKRELKKSIAITHMNEHEIDKRELKNTFSDFNIYVSDGMTHNDMYTLIESLLLKKI